MEELHSINPLMRLNKKEAKNHVIFWVIILLYFNIFSSVPGTWSAKIVSCILDDFNALFVFYSLSLLIFPGFWESKRLLFLGISILIVGFLYLTNAYFIYFKIIHSLGGTTPYERISVFQFIAYNLLYYFVFASAGAAAFFYRYSVYKFALQEERGKSLLVKELNFLKNQFNSHITFNFLTYCYSNIYQKLPDTAESISLFADMLRYTITTRPDEKVSVSDEITYIENFISLKKLLGTEIFVKFSYDGKMDDIVMLPRILTTFVENAFKHGLYDDPTCPINITLEIKNNKLVFIVTNKVNSKKRLNSTYRGLDNVKQMLNLYYANDHVLTIEENEGLYKVKLSLGLRTGEGTSKMYGKINKPAIMPESSLQGLDAGRESLMRLDKKQIPGHIFIWTLIVTYLTVIDTISGSWLVKIVSGILIDSNFIFVYYTLSLVVFPRFWARNRYLLLVGIFLCLSLYWCYYYFICVKIVPLFGVNTYYQTAPLYFFFNSTFFYFFIFALAGIASFFYRYGLYKLKQQVEKENILLTRELSCLKDQFNSHLTFNFLSYCYSNVHKKWPEMAESIGIFSNMLRYTLQKGAEEKVTVKEEIAYIENFISIQRLLTSEVCVSFEYDSKMEDKKILSRVLVIFVENAFKHGVLNDPLSPILIQLRVKDNQLVFTVRNSIKPPLQIPRPYKEVENVKQILELYYANNHKLERGEKDGFYNVELRMGLEEEVPVSGFLIGAGVNINDCPEPVSVPNKFSIQYSLKKMLAVAAVVCFALITSIYYLGSSSGDKLFRQHYERYSSPELRYSNPEADVKYLYATGNFQGAVALSGQILKTEPFNSIAHFYAGLSFLELKQYQDAIENLSFAAESEDKIFTYPAQWYLSLSYIKTGQPEYAKKVLYKLAISDFPVYSKKAGALLKDLE